MESTPAPLYDDAVSSEHPRTLAAWQRLEEHRDSGPGKTLTDLFAQDPSRFSRFTLETDALFLDYSKNLIDRTTLALLLELGQEAGVAAAVEDMFAGKAINATESRPVLHVALRARPEDKVAPNVPGVGDVAAVLREMNAFGDGIRTGDVCGASGEPLTDIVNIGIGGSDLGPVMAARALRPYWQDGMRFHSVSNVDGTQLVDLQRDLDPRRTLFVVCSKTFTTQETMTNAHAARAWIARELGESAVSAQFAAASTNHAAMDAFGIDDRRRFGFWDWVGGRYSLWSAVGLSLSLVVGYNNFQRLLDGGRAMDRHFRTAPLETNMPVLLALIGIWNNNFLGAESQAILPYDNRLDRFPAYLQQLQMESSGKSVRLDGTPVAVSTGAVVWGESGSNAQHSFYQLLHQGTRFVPVDFILPLRSRGAPSDQRELAIANCLAQSEALMEGYAADDAHRVHSGNRPSNTLLMDALTPESLGQLISLYEHKVFVENTIWGTNAFDQFGVELGKKLSRRLESAVSAGSGENVENPSTAGLLARIGRSAAQGDG